MSALALKTGLAYPATRRRAPKLPRRSEKAFQAVVVELARALGFTSYHTFDSRRSNVGFPDLVLAKRGRLLFAELKAAGGQPTPDQLLWLDLLRSTGAEAYMWFDDGNMRAIADILAGRTR